VEEHRSGKRPAISAYLITRNEEKNIARSIESVRWMDEVVVLDSGSTDRTVEIAERMGAKVWIEPFQGFVIQKNRAMEFCTGEWMFNLDADEEVTPELRESILVSIAGTGTEKSPSVFAVCRRTRYMGRWIRHCGWYPEYRERLSRKGCARWEGEMLHEGLRGEGAVSRLAGDLLHRPYDDLGAHVRKIDEYTNIWARRELSKGRRAGLSDLAGRPAARFMKMYFLRAGFLDGIPGFAVSVMGAWYTFMKYARLYEMARSSE
jgi:(heptosyl)LPS beta-1,4-glucosyltransferase